MATYGASPRGLLSDEEEAAVFESTAAETGGGQRGGHRLAELSVISPGADAPAPVRQLSADAGVEKVKVFLRIRPLTEAERERGEDQCCVSVEGEDTLLLRAPQDSAAMRNTERGVGQAVHRFTFTQICRPDTSQKEFFEHTMRETVRDVLRGESWLVYTYGVTNSGKTYTVQGVGSDGGLLPRSLATVFGSLQGRLYPSLDLKPVLCQQVRWLDSAEVRIEELRRAALLQEDECQTPQRSRVRGVTSYDSGIGSLSANSCSATRLDEPDSVCLDFDGLSLDSSAGAEGVRYSVWVSFFEIYNEFLYDLLNTPPGQLRKRATLRLCDDRHGNPYVKDLTWVNVRSAEEAWRVLQVGRRNQSFASTHLNQASSRSHSIFSIRILHINPDAPDGQGARISELSLCDLAGSERCKEQRCGERMKEANNINTSLHTLGRCIAALRHNQAHRSKPPKVVPFRDSKLTRVFQSFFCGRGRSCMIVNINPCASTYDETLQALKFSAIATQLVHTPPTRTRVAYIQSLLREHGMKINESKCEEEEEEGGATEEESEEEEEEIAMFDTKALLRAVEVLKQTLLGERRERAALEANIREQVVSEMMELLNRREEDFSETLQSERELLEEQYEDKIQNLQESLKRYYSREIQERDEQIEEITAALQEAEKKEPPAPSPPPLALRRSQRLASQGPEQRRLQAELEQSRAELEQKTKELQQYHDLVRLAPTETTLTARVDRKLEESQRNVRLLRQELSTLGTGLQSAERACCHNTAGEKLRLALEACDSILAKQDQTLADLQNNMLLVKMDLKRKAESLAELQRSGQYPPLAASGTASSCKRRGCGVADLENVRPQKRPLLHGLFHKRNTPTPQTPSTPYSCILRSRQQTPTLATPSKYRLKL